jgi:recombination protein RecA
MRQVLAAAKKKYGLEVGPVADIVEPVIPLSSGNIGIDHITGIGGFPRGRHVELFGPPSSGKTTCALQCAAWVFQNTDDSIVYLDYEQALDEAYCKALGLDINSDRFLFAQPDTLEQGANVARQLIATGKVGVAVFDSVEAMLPEAMSEAETGKVLVATRARELGQFLAQLNPMARETGTLCVFVNHEKDVIDMSPGRRPSYQRTTTPGGKALKFYASLRLQFAHIQGMKSTIMNALTNEPEEIMTAQDIRVRVVKNKVGPPYRSARVRLRYGRGFDNLHTAIQVLIAHDIIDYSTGWYHFSGTPALIHPEMPRTNALPARPYIRGEAALAEFGDTHSDWSATVVDLAIKTLAEASEDSNPVDDIPAVASQDDEDVVD